MRKKSKGLLVLNLDGTVYGKKYFSITEAAKYLRCNIKTISRILKTGKKILKRR
jgi:hypothetical protein